jgi:hypothetical protein
MVTATTATTTTTTQRRGRGCRQRLGRRRRRRSSSRAGRRRGGAARSSLSRLAWWTLGCGTVSSAACASEAPPPSQRLSYRDWCSAMPPPPPPLWLWEAPPPSATAAAAPTPIIPLPGILLILLPSRLLRPRPTTAAPLVATAPRRSFFRSAGSGTLRATAASYRRLSSPLPQWAEGNYKGSSSSSSSRERGMFSRAPQQPQQSLPEKWQRTLWPRVFVFVFFCVFF